MNMTRALIIRKEHLTNIFDNGKVWEMRSSKTNARGRIGLIEAGSGLIVGETFLAKNWICQLNNLAFLRFCQLAAQVWAMLHRTDAKN